MRPSATRAASGPRLLRLTDPQFVVFAKGVSTGTSSAAMTFFTWSCHDAEVIIRRLYECQRAPCFLTVIFSR